LHCKGNLLGGIRESRTELWGSREHSLNTTELDNSYHSRLQSAGGPLNFSFRYIDKDINLGTVDFMFGCVMRCAVPHRRRLHRVTRPCWWKCRLVTENRPSFNGIIISHFLTEHWTEVWAFRFRHTLQPTCTELKAWDTFCGYVKLLRSSQHRFLRAARAWLRLSTRSSIHKVCRTSSFTEKRKMLACTTQTLSQEKKRVQGFYINWLFASEVCTAAILVLLTV
jgi:hypothetical protein